MYAGSVELRDAGPDDFDTVRDLLGALHGSPPWGDERSADARATFERILSNPTRRLLLAFVGDVAAGMIDAIVVPNLTRNARPWTAIENIVVLPEMRRRGIGRMLIEGAIDHARAQDCYKVQLVSATKREEAHALYRAAGFDGDVQGYRRYLIELDP